MMAIASCLRAPCPRGRAVGARLLRPRVVASSPTRAGALRLHAGLRAVASSNGIRSRSAAKDIGAQWHWQAAAASCVAGSSSGGSDGSGSAARRVFVPAVARHGRGRGAGSGGSGLRCISAATASETLPSDGGHARRRCAQACELSPGDMPGGGRQSTSVLPLHPQRSDSERQTCARARRPRLRRIDHICICVRHVPTSIRWYQEVLGLQHECETRSPPHVPPRSPPT